MKVAVIGSRKFTNTQLLESILDNYKTQITCIISGGARGADQLAESWATTNNIKTMIFKPDWSSFGKSAGYRRNIEIVKNCDLCIAFWDGESKGTAHSISLCKQHDKKIHVIYFK